MRCCLALLWLGVSLAQTSELRLGQAKTKTETVVRARPDANSPAIFQLPQGSAVRTIDGQTKGGFVRVIGDRGPQGWIPAETVETTGPALAAGCPKTEDQGRKKFGGSGQVNLFDFNDLLKLQTQAERTGGEPKSGDGKLVRVGGYLARKSEGPHVAGPCVGGAADDWILNVTQDADAKDFQSFVARIPAFKRNPKWTLETLKTVWMKQYPILITGALHYDGSAIVNDDSANPVPAQLHRSWLWELRQVSSILVCVEGACEAGSSKGWVALDQMN